MSFFTFKRNINTQEIKKNSIIFAIKTQALKESLFISVSIFIFITTLLLLLSYEIYFVFPNKLIHSVSVSISRNYTLGNEFEIRNLIYQIVHEEEFSAAWLISKNNVLIRNVPKDFSSMVKNYDSAFGVTFVSGRFFLIRKIILNEQDTFCYVAKALPIFLIPFIYFLLITFLLAFIKFTKAKRIENEKAKIEIVELTAFANSIKMLAHDIKKPFSMLNATLLTLNPSEDPEKLRKEILKSKIEVGISMKKVNDMIADFMTCHHRIEAIPPLDYIESIYLNFLHSHHSFANTSIDFHYNLLSKNHLLITKSAFDRILNNLLSNALEAMGRNGKIWIYSENIQKFERLFTRFTIGNDHSYIEESLIEKIFEMGFSSGKKNGSGIGLFGVRKFIEKHGGMIFCRSSKEVGVEFIFDIPSVTNEIIDEKIVNKLPKNSSILAKEYERIFIIEKSFEIQENDRRFLNHFINLKKKITVLITDDEYSYVSSIKKVFRHIFSLLDQNNLEFLVANDFEKTIGFFEKQKIDIFICDIDLDNSYKDGFFLVEHLNKNFDTSDTFICVHSNRVFSTEYILDFGAHYYAQKPIEENSLISMLKKYFADFSKPVPLLKKERVIVIDDNEIYLNMWRTSLIGAEVSCFLCPDDFVNEIQENRLSLSEISFMIVDYYFDGFQKNIFQMNFVDLIRRYGFTNPCFLSSNVMCSTEELSCFDGFLEKQPHSLENIKANFSSFFNKV